MLFDLRELSASGPTIQSLGGYNAAGSASRQYTPGSYAVLSVESLSLVSAALVYASTRLREQISYGGVGKIDVEEALPCRQSPM